MPDRPTFAERVGRSYRRDPFFSMWGRGALLVLMAALLVAACVGGRGELAVWLGLALVFAFLVWMGLVFRWSRAKALRRAAWRRRRES